MIYFNWSAVTGLVSWKITEPYRKKLKKVYKTHKFKNQRAQDVSYNRTQKK